MAAVKVIVEKAIGKVTSIFCEEQRYDQSIQSAIISNGLIHDEVVNVIKNCIVER